MKISTRVKWVVIAALLAAMFVVGSAWAAQSPEAVKQAIEDFGLAAAISGSTITVTNSATNPLVKNVATDWVQSPDPSRKSWYWLLNLGDLTGLTIDWKANLTVTGVQNVDDGIDAIVFQNGTFNITAGTIDIQTTGIGWMNSVEGEGRSAITVSGGTIQGATESHGGVTADSGGAKVTVTGGTIRFPMYAAVMTDSFEMTGGTIIGLVGYTASDNRPDNRHDVVEVYGSVERTSPLDFDDPDRRDIDYIVKNGAAWSISSDVVTLSSKSHDIMIEAGGKLIVNGVEIKPLNNNGTITIKEGGTLVNNAVINNYSPNTIDNQGTWINNGALNNKPTGKIKNTGTIDNANGTIVNEGAIDNTGGTIKSDPKRYSGNAPTGNAVEPLDEEGGSSGGSSGCNTGFGLFGLAAFAFVLLRRK